MISDQPGKVKIRQLPTGVRGLDDVMHSGLPEFSFNIIVGAPGCGKTTLAHQIIFANATPQRPTLYFAVLGEPALKMLLYQQQYSFFDPARMGKAVRFIMLSDLVLKKELDAVLEEITREVQASNPSMVVVDSFRTVARKARSAERGKRNDGVHSSQPVWKLAQAGVNPRLIYRPVMNHDTT